MNRIRCIALLLALSLPLRASEWKLAWSDEFDYNGRPDPAKWDYEHGFVRTGELQYYQPENAICTNGMLVIEARRERKPNPDYRPDGRGWKNRQWIDYTSACLITKAKHDFTYGKFEIRARIDTRLGSWPAFWTLGTSIDKVRWPACGEIDIMEYYTNIVLANVCYARNGRQQWLTTTRSLADLGADSWSKEFHVWTMEWSGQQIDLSLDGKLSAHFNVADADKAGVENPFRSPQYLLINQAIGGRCGGDPSGTVFPVRYEVDWVRVYQREDAAPE